MNLTEPEKTALGNIKCDLAVTIARLWDANSTMKHARALYDQTAQTIRLCELQIADLLDRAKAITNKTNKNP